MSGATRSQFVSDTSNAAVFISAVQFVTLNSSGVSPAVTIASVTDTASRRLSDGVDRDRSLGSTAGSVSILFTMLFDVGVSPYANSTSAYSAVSTHYLSSVASGSFTAVLHALAVASGNSFLTSTSSSSCTAFQSQAITFANPPALPTTRTGQFNPFACPLSLSLFVCQLRPLFP